MSRSRKKYAFCLTQVYTEKPTQISQNKAERGKIEHEVDETGNNEVRRHCEEMIKACNTERIKTLNLLKA